MRDLSPALAARLASGATTLCQCWSLARRDGLVLGFTDHDRDLAFGGLTYAARSGLAAAEASRELGFAVSGGDVAG
ncbi:baseplate hub domain-containing protein, partial [Methylobacterium oxalidis]